MEEYFDFISKHALFEGIAPEELRSLLGCLSARVAVYPKDAPVFLEGDPAGSIGFVLEGAVEIVHDDFYGNRSLLTVAEAGELFGEGFACAGLDTMPVSGYAISDCKLMWLECRKMLTVCSNACRFHGALIQNLLQVVAHHNLLLSQKIRIMSQKTTRDKLMLYLLEQAKQKGSAEFTIPLSRQALADYLGVERSAMSATLSRLRDEGALEFHKNYFRLLRHDEEER